MNAGRSPLEIHGYRTPETGALALIRFRSDLSADYFSPLSDIERISEPHRYYPRPDDTLWSVMPAADPVGAKGSGRHGDWVAGSALAALVLGMTTLTVVARSRRHAPER